MKSPLLLGVLFSISFCSCVQSALSHRKFSRADSVKIHDYELKSNHALNQSPDSAFHFAWQGLELARRVNYPLGEAMMLGQLARVSERYEHWILAAKYQKEAIELYLKLPNTPKLAATYADLGSLLGKEHHFREATRYLSKALEAYRKTGTVSGIISVYIKWGEVDELDGHPEKALQFYQQALKLNQGQPLSDDYFTLLTYAGDAHAKKGDYLKALEYYRKGIRESNHSNYIRTNIDLLRKTGQILDVLGDKQAALDHHQQSLQKARQFNLPKEEIRSLMSIAKVIKNQDVDQSFVHLNNAMSIARLIKNKPLEAEIYLTMAGVYKDQSRYQQALAALEDHHRLLDSLLETNRKREIATLQKNYELQEARLNVQKLEMTNRQRTLERDVVVLAIVIVLMLIVILWIYFSRTKQLNRKLQESNRVKDKLFSIIGHDLRGPLAGMVQVLELMEEEDLPPEETKPLISEMSTRTSLVLNTLNSLLTWGRIQLKGMSIKPVNFTPAALIEQTIQILGRQAVDKSLSIVNLVPPDTQVHGDPDHFDYIIRNLVSNAIKFSYSGGQIEIGVDSRRILHKVVFYVRDYGKGISEAQLQLFKKSNLEVSFGTSGEKGTGIGLMLAKEFIQANTGVLWIESAENEGATFYFSFNEA
jgi:signal transduction histidine kinase